MPVMETTHLLFFDGTENHPHKVADGPAGTAREASNVQVLREAISSVPFSKPGDVDYWAQVSDANPGNSAVVYYMPGVGSPGGPQASKLLSDRRVLRGETLASVAGVGAAEQIMHAYVELARRFKTGDRIVAIGFSRGACSARSFCGLLNSCGIRQRHDDEADPAFARRVYSEYRGRQKVGEAVPVDLCVCFDCVPGPIGLFSKRHHDFNAPNIKRFLHLISMDENRKSFACMRWEGSSLVAESVWYPGVHSDVGGGYGDISDVGPVFHLGPLLSVAGAVFKSTRVSFDDKVLLRGRENAFIYGDRSPANSRDSQNDFLRQHLFGVFGGAIAKCLAWVGIGTRTIPAGEKLHVSATFWLILISSRATDFSRAFAGNQEALDYALKHTHDDTGDVEAYLRARGMTPGPDCMPLVSVRVISEVVRDTIAGDVIIPCYSDESKRR